MGPLMVSNSLNEQIDQINTCLLDIAYGLSIMLM